jgi:hypothetical protein
MHPEVHQQLGLDGREGGEFSLPHSIVIDSSGQLYVADRNNCRVQVFDQSGKFLRAFSGKMVPWTLHITDKDEIYVIGSSPDRWPRTGRMNGIPPRDQIVMRINPKLEILSWWAFDFQPDAKLATTRPGALCWAHALAVDGTGTSTSATSRGSESSGFSRRDRVKLWISIDQAATRHLGRDPRARRLGIAPAARAEQGGAHRLRSIAQQDDAGKRQVRPARQPRPALHPRNRPGKLDQADPGDADRCDRLRETAPGHAHRIHRR